MHSKLRRWILVLACGGAAAAGIAACGGDDDASTSSSGGGGAAKEASGEPIKIMTIGPLTGTTQLPGLEDGAQAAAKAINDAGGVNGRPIEIIACDDRYDPNRTQACARQAVSEGVVAVTGIPQVGKSLMPAIEAAGIPVMTAGASPDEYNSDLWFPAGPGYAPLAFGVGSVWCSLPTDNVVLFNLDIAGALVYQDLYNAGIESCGKKFVDTELIPINASDVTSYVTKALQKKPDGAYLSLGQPFNFKVAEALHNANPDMVIATNYTSWDFEVSKIEGLLFQQLAIPPSVQPADDRVDQFNKEYEAYGAKSTASEAAEIPWTAVHVVAEFAKDLDTVDAKSLVAAFKAAGEQQYGPMPAWDWSKPFKIKDQTAYGKQISWVKYEGGQVKPLFDDVFVDVTDPPAAPQS